MNKINLHIIGSDTFVNFLNELELNYNIIFNDNLTTNKKTDFVRIVFLQDLKLIERNKYLHQHINMLTEGLIKVRLDNKKLAKQCEDQMKQFRNKGAL